MLKDDDDMPTMANRGQTPYIPTGYEGLTASAQRKRRIGEALMQKGLAGPGDNVRSWAQVLGSLAQTWAGKSIQASADKEESEAQQKMQADIAAANQAFEADVQAGADPQTMVQKHGANPWVRARLAPYEKALSTGLTNKQEYAAPTEMLGADGKPTTVQINKAGDLRPVQGGFSLPPVMTDVNGVATALQRKPDGSVLPQNLTDSVIRGPDGKPMVNKEALDAKVRVAAAGAPTNNSKIVIEGEKDANKAGLGIIEESFKKAQGARQTLGLVDNVRQALDSGKVSSGPLSDAKSFIERITGTNADGLSRRRTVEQSLAQAAIAARPQMGSGTSISMGEQALIDKAALGDITKFTNGELYATAKAIEKLSIDTLDSHDSMIAKSRRLPYGPAVDLFVIDRPQRYQRAPAKPKAKPVARRGLPPKGAEAKPAAKPKYSDLFPTPAGGR